MSTPAAKRRQRRSARRGAALVEAALVLPVVILFLFGILEYGRYIMMLQIVTNAAREGAHYALTHTQPVVIDDSTSGNATADVTNEVNKYMAGKSLVGQTIQVFKSDSVGVNTGIWTTTDIGDSVCVQINGNFPVIVGRLLFLNSTIPVEAKCVMRSESN